MGRNGWKSMGGVGMVGEPSGEDCEIAVVGVVHADAPGDEDGRGCKRSDEVEDDMLLGEPGLRGNEFGGGESVTLISGLFGLESDTLGFIFEDSEV